MSATVVPPVESLDNIDVISSSESFFLDGLILRQNEDLLGNTPHSKVYKRNWKNDKKVVAVKRMDKVIGNEEGKDALLSMEHENVVKLLGVAEDKYSYR